MIDESHRAGSALRRWLTEPIIHFLVLGALLFGVHAMLAGPTTAGVDEHLIRVTDEALAKYIQYNDRAFSRHQKERARALLAGMAPRERQDLLDAYVREEALYREALSLGLDQTDYVIRRRLVQSMEYLFESAASAPEIEHQEALDDWFEQNRDRYVIPPAATFSHVFFSNTLWGEAGARAKAEAALLQLSGEAAAFDQAPRHGDRFPYHVNYVEASRDLVASHFGGEVAEQVFVDGSVATGWQGPIASRHGYHLLLVVDRNAGGLPDLNEIRSLALADFRRDRVQARQQALIAAAVASYRTEIAQ